MLSRYCHCVILNTGSWPVTAFRRNSIWRGAQVRQKWHCVSSTYLACELREGDTVLCSGQRSFFFSSLNLRFHPLRSACKWCCAGQWKSCGVDTVVLLYNNSSCPGANCCSIGVVLERKPRYNDMLLYEVLPAKCLGNCADDHTTGLWLFSGP